MPQRILLHFVALRIWCFRFEAWPWMLRKYDICINEVTTGWSQGCRFDMAVARCFFERCADRVA